MSARAQFTASDLRTLERAAALAENLIQRHFDLSCDEWMESPYGIFTLKEVDQRLFRDHTFAHVIRYPMRSRVRSGTDADYAFGIVLQDPTILRALLRSELPDLWTIGLYVLTHELVHIVRFRKYGVDFCAPTSVRDREERVVHGMTRDILKGVSNTDCLLGLYESDIPHMRGDMRRIHGG